MVAARGRNDATHLGPLASKRFGIDQAASELEGAGRRVILVLDSHLGASALGH